MRIPNFIAFTSITLKIQFMAKIPLRSVTCWWYQFHWTIRFLSKKENYISGKTGDLFIFLFKIKTHLVLMSSSRDLVECATRTLLADRRAVWSLRSSTALARGLRLSLYCLRAARRSGAWPASTGTAHWAFAVSRAEILLEASSIPFTRIRIFCWQTVEKFSWKRGQMKWRQNRKGSNVMECQLQHFTALSDFNICDRSSSFSPDTLLLEMMNFHLPKWNVIPNSPFKDNDNNKKQQ